MRVSSGFSEAGMARASCETLLLIADPRPMDYRHWVTAVAEIESAIEKLSPSEVKELAAGLDEYQQMINASAEMFSIYDHSEQAYDI